MNSSTNLPDLSLENAVGKALENNYGIRVAQLNSEISHLNDHWGNAGALPQIGIALDGSQSEIDMSKDSTVVPILRTEFDSYGLNSGLVANWTVFDGMGMFAAKHSLELLASQSDNQVELIIEQTVEAVDFAYHNVLVQIELLQVLSESMDLSRIRLKGIVWSEEYGVAGTFDRLQFENAIITDSTSYLMQEIAVNTSIRNLNRLMGESEDLRWNFTSDLDIPPSIGELQDLQQKVVSDNSLVRNASLTSQISTEGVKLAQARMYPVIGLGAAYRQTDNRFSVGEQSLSSGNNTTAITLTLNFNLFNGGATKRAISEAVIKQEIAELGIQDQKAEVIKLVADAHDRYRVNASIYELSTNATSNSQIALEIAESRYGDGVVSSLDYRALAIALQASRVQEYQALQAWRASYIEIQRLIGALRAPLN